MIVTRAPFRLPLGGGGTDLPAYYKQYGGSLITATINKYVYVFINRPPIADKIKLHYSQIEDVDDVGSIKHGIIRECLNILSIKDKIEITSMADFGAGTGMGSSSAFTVALLSGLCNEYDIKITKRELANLACTVEIDILGNPIGKQDQFASAYGGIRELAIDKTGIVTVNDMVLSSKTIYGLSKRLLMFYTNIQRSANEILAKEGKKTEKDPSLLKEIHEIGLKIKVALQNDDIDNFGRLMDSHWNVKRQITDKMSTNKIDECYEMGKENGALGGKVMGAGGGGLLLFCVKEGTENKITESMKEQGFNRIGFGFEFNGVQSFNY